MSGITLHVLCHSYITNLRLVGADHHTMKELAGHASYRTTEIYTHGDSVSKRHAVDALDPFLGELPLGNGEASVK